MFASESFQSKHSPSFCVNCINCSKRLIRIKTYTFMAETKKNKTPLRLIFLFFLVKGIEGTEHLLFASLFPTVGSGATWKIMAFSEARRKLWAGCSGANQSTFLLRNNSCNLLQPYASTCGQCARSRFLGAVRRRSYRWLNKCRLKLLQQYVEMPIKYTAVQKFGVKNVDMQEKHCFFFSMKITLH